MCAPPDGWQDAIAANNQAFMDAFHRKDAAGLAAAYTANGNALPPNMPMVTGTEALQGLWHAILEMGIADVKLETLELEGFEDTAIEVGAFTLLSEGGDVIDDGNFIVIWKLVDGAWRWHHDIWNSNRAAT
jgi:ketosteroid isomerase-like protein